VAAIAEVSESLGGWIDFISTLMPCPEDVLCTPIEEGKWSVRDIVSHIMGWDKDFMKTLDRIIRQGEAILQEHHDVQAFNEASVAYGRTMKPHDLLREAAFQREQLIRKLQQVSEEAFTRPMHGSPYTLETFLQEMFVNHDRHHEKQILRYLQSRT